MTEKPITTRACPYLKAIKLYGNYTNRFWETLIAPISQIKRLTSLLQPACYLLLVCMMCFADLGRLQRVFDPAVFLFSVDPLLLYAWLAYVQ